MKVVLLAGGMGTRLAEYTEARPKPMVEVGGRPILWYVEGKKREAIRLFGWTLAIFFIVMVALLAFLHILG